MTVDARSLAFRDLRAAIAAVRQHLDPKAATALADLAAAVECLDRPPPVEGLGDFAPDRLERLLALAGPEIASKLLLQLAADLIQCRDEITRAVAHDDWQSGRNGSHVLMSLSGSVGALSLQALAEALNAAAHRQDGAEAARLLPQILAELAALIRLIEATPPPLVSASTGDDQ